jgi:hypothetical protein
MKYQSGQAVLIILLSMVVALTVVLSIIASSTSDIKISSTETQSLRAFSAAESGVEQALVTNSGTQGNVNGGASYNAVVSGLAQGQTYFINPNSLASGDGGVFWFVSHGANGVLTCGNGSPCFTGKTIKLCWGNAGTPGNVATSPALEVSTFYLTNSGNYATTQVAKAVFDPNPTRRGNNSYSPTDGGSCTVGSRSFAFQKQIDLSTLGVPAGSYGVANGLQFTIVKMLYNSNNVQPVALDVGFAGNTPLPGQGSLVDSTGNLSQVTRKVEVTRTYNGIPPVFDTAVFSPQGLSQ